MARYLLLSVGLATASSFLVLDSAVKGTAILLLATAGAALLRCDSAATRHTIWLAAIVAVLVLPAFSLLLPEWNVLPYPAALRSSSPPTAFSPSTAKISEARDDSPLVSEVQPSKADSTSTFAPDAAPSQSLSKNSELAAGFSNWHWLSLVGPIWLGGVGLLTFRLLFARWLLLRSTASAVELTSSDEHDELLSTFQLARQQLGFQQPVTLLIHPGDCIPLVWGILRYRLLLPQGARDWNPEQLRSVLLHELAHLQRRDTWSQLLTQVACTLNWFNPLVWVAAWQLGVERERACDDLVLASGVRPSQYAGHLLDVVHRLSENRWTTTCGLAMARQSSLEGRLLAILSNKRNRRSVSAAAAAVAIGLAVGLAIPLAMLHAMEQAPATETKPVVVPQPKDEYGRKLFQIWRGYARTDGKIPGALVGQLSREIESYRGQFPADEKSTRLAALLPRIVATRDWTPEETVALLDDITAIATAPVGWVELPLTFDGARDLKRGSKLPDNLATADWGAPAKNGLRAAWLLEPRAEKYPLGTVLKTRVLFHNTSKTPVIINIETWRQFDGHDAIDAADKKIKINGTVYSGVTLTALYRLGPGEYCEVPGHGLAVGAGEYVDEFSAGAVGAIIEAKAGDDVRLSHTVSTNEGGWTKPSDPKDPAERWKKSIAERVGREAPLPASAADREQLIRRATLDAIGEVPADEEIKEFVADKDADALTKLTTRLQNKPRPVPFDGVLKTGETKFQVTPADPDAAKRPRTANAPGRYVLSERAHLLVSQTTTNSQRTNKALIAFLSADPKVASPHEPYEIALPDGLQSWGAAWERDGNELWVVQKGLTRKFNFADPAKVKEERFEDGSLSAASPAMQEALKKVFAPADAPAPQQPKLREGTQLAPDVEKRLAWGPTANGLRAAIIIRETPDEKKPADKLDLFLVVQNISKEPFRVVDQTKNAKLRSLQMRVGDRITGVIADEQPSQTDTTLKPNEVTYYPIFITESKSDTGRPASHFIVDGLLADPRESLIAELNITTAPAGAWKGSLITGATTGAIAAGLQQPKEKVGQQLLASFQEQARANGNIPGGLVALLGEKVLEFVRNNSGDASGDPYAKKMAPLISRFAEVRDRTPAEVVKLLDEVASANTIPLETTYEHLSLQQLRTGKPLPKELATAPWGKSNTSGLRTAWLLEPRGNQHRLGTALKAKILIHNDGKQPVVFRTRSWHQFNDHRAQDAQGKEIKVDSTYWTTLSSLVSYRLAPGEFIELNAAGIGIGDNRTAKDWPGTRVGSWFDAPADTEVTFQPAAVPLSDWNEADSPKSDWWLAHIQARLQRAAPLPKEAQERIRLLDQVSRDLFGTAATAQETAAFVADEQATAGESLAKRLHARQGIVSFRGDLIPAAIKFQVTAAEAAEKKK
ncbi:M56 family metallopeptidase [Anatilimnocola floriformis]|uniref:M56 family metallopeptidase n=1 Tax=Anatilimnocola floriformis TaxID=2948575 RepID=UPI0020C2DD41|nr:M56 family metallopeptidase [Anatilimnocola floriformis]